MGYNRLMSIVIRPFTPEDAPAVIDIYNQARPIEIAHLSEDRFWSWFSDKALDPCRDILLAADKAGPVGLVVAFPWPGHLAEGAVFFVGPSVLPEFQHKGIGLQLMEALEAHTLALYPGKRLQTRLEANNTKAHAFLVNKAGFKVERRFWLMTHAALGTVRPAPPIPGVTFEYLLPGQDPTAAVSLYQSILDPAAGHHLLDDAQIKLWTGLDTFQANSFLLARQGTSLVGLCFQTFTRGLPHGQIRFLGVLPPFRGQGLATALLKQALIDASQNGKTTVQLEVSGADDTLETALYRRNGFEVAGGEVFYERPLHDVVAPI
jgi:mycothiol synthase